MNPSELLAYGQSLVETAGVSHPIRRAAARTLYYAIHHEACRRYFRKFPAGQPLNKISRHQCLLDRFEEEEKTKGDRLAATIRGQLHWLRRLRSIADYEIEAARCPSPQQLSVELRIAQELMDRLERWAPGGPTRARDPVPLQ